MKKITILRYFTLFLSIVFLYLTGCEDPNNNNSVAHFGIQIEKKPVWDVSKNTLLIYFSTEIKSVNPENVIIQKNNENNKKISSNEYTVEYSGKTVQIRFTNKQQYDSTFEVTFLKNSLIDINGYELKEKKSIVVHINLKSDPPGLISTKNLIRDDNKLLVHFDKELKVQAVSTDKIVILHNSSEISQSSYSLEISGQSLAIRLNDSVEFNLGDFFQVWIKPGAVVSVDNIPSIGTLITDVLTLADLIPPELLSLGSNLAVSITDRILVVKFNEDLMDRQEVNKTKIKVKQNGSDVDSNHYTELAVTGNQLFIKLDIEITQTDIFYVKILSDAVIDTSGNSNIQVLETNSITVNSGVIIPRILWANITADKISIHFNTEVQIKEKSKIIVNINNTLFNGYLITEKIDEGRTIVFNLENRNFNDDDQIKFEFQSSAVQSENKILLHPIILEERYKQELQISGTVENVNGRSLMVSLATNQFIEEYNNQGRITKASSYKPHPILTDVDETGNYTLEHIDKTGIENYYEFFIWEDLDFNRKVNVVDSIIEDAFLPMIDTENGRKPLNNILIKNGNLYFGIRTSAGIQYIPRSFSLHLSKIHFYLNDLPGTPIRVKSSSPVDGAVEVDVNSDFRIRFDRRIELNDSGTIVFELDPEIGYDSYTRKYGYYSLRKDNIILDADEQGILIPKNRIFSLGSRNLLLTKKYIIRFNRMIIDPSSGRNMHGKIKFTTHTFELNKNIREDNEYIIPTESEWRKLWYYRSDYQIENMKKAAKKIGLSYAQNNQLYGDNIKIGLFDTAVIPEKREYNAVVFVNQHYKYPYYLENRRADGSYNDNHGTKMVRYMLEYAPKINIYSYNKSIPRIRLTYDQSPSGIAYRDLDIFSSSGSGLSLHYNSIREMIDNGTIVSRSSGNDPWYKNISGYKAKPEEPGKFEYYKHKEVFFPYLYDISQSSGAFVIVGAVYPQDGKYPQTSRQQLGELRYFGISVYENGVGATSQATAVFSAICALMLDYNRRLNAGFTPREIVEILLETADDVGDEGVDEIYGYGVVNLEKALKKLAKKEKAAINLYSDLDKEISDYLKSH